MTRRFESKTGEVSAWWIQSIWWINFIDSVWGSSLEGRSYSRIDNRFEIINSHLKKYDACLSQEEDPSSDDTFLKIHVLEFKDEESFLAFVLAWS